MFLKDVLLFAVIVVVWVQKYLKTYETDIVRILKKPALQTKINSEKVFEN